MSKKEKEKVREDCWGIIAVLALFGFLLSPYSLSLEPSIETYNAHQTDSPVSCRVRHDGVCSGFLFLPEGTELPSGTLEEVHQLAVVYADTGMAAELEVEEFQLSTTLVEYIHRVEIASAPVPQGTDLEFHVVYYTHSFLSSIHKGGVITLRIIGTILAAAFAALLLYAWWRSQSRLY